MTETISAGKDEDKVKTTPINNTRRIKEDAIDYKTKAERIAGLPMFALGVTLLFGDSLLSGSGYINVLDPIPTAAFASMFGGGLLGVKTIFDEMSSQDIQDSQTLKDPDLGYRADRIVYRGADLNFEGGKLKKGDNFYHLQLPSFIDKTPLQAQGGDNPERMRAASQAYTFILKDARERLSGRDYKAIVIDFEDRGFPHVAPPVKNGTSVERGKLFEGKDADIAHPKAETIILSREVYDSIPFEANEFFQQTIDAFEDEVGNKHAGALLVEELRNLKYKPLQEKLAEADKLRAKLDNFFNSQAESTFNGLPDVAIDRTNPSFPVRKRSDVHPVIKPIRTANGDFLQEISYLQGNKRMLIRLDIPLEEIVTANSQYRPLLLSYALSNMLSTAESVEEVTRDMSPDIEDVLDDLRTQDIGLAGVNQKKNPVYLNKKRGQYRKSLKRILLAAMLGGVMTTGIKAFHDLPPIPSGNNSTAEIQNQPDIRIGKVPTSKIEEVEKPAFPESLPESHLDWKITSYGREDPEGYYVTSTSNSWKEGQWLINNTFDQNSALLDNQELLQPIGSGVPHLDLTGGIQLDDSKTAALKLPVKIGTTLVGLKISDFDGNLINPNSYLVRKLEDGTFELDIFLDSSDINSYVQVTESLIGSEHSPHATKRIPAIDTHGLSRTAVDLLRTSGNTLIGLRNQISDRPYSINPQGKEVLDGINGTAESFIDAAASLPASDCDIANSEFALLSSTMATDRYLNVARGYINGENQPGSVATSFLDAKAGHEFTISNEGLIFDATPNRSFANDEMTKQFVFGGKGANGPSPEEVWNKQQEVLKQQQEKAAAEIKKQKDLVRDLQIILGLGTLASGVFIAPKGIGLIRRTFTKDRAEKVHSKIAATNIISHFNIAELEEAYRFFSWLSFGGDRKFSPDSLIPQTQTRPQALQRLKQGSAQTGKLKDYLKDPEKFEREAGLKAPRKMRRLAKYLLNN